jgi:hypothetical protein
MISRFEYFARTKIIGLSSACLKFLPGYLAVTFGVSVPEALPKKWGATRFHRADHPCPCRTVLTTYPYPAGRRNRRHLRAGMCCQTLSRPVHFSIWSRPGRYQVSPGRLKHVRFLSCQRLVWFMLYPYPKFFIHNARARCQACLYHEDIKISCDHKSFSFVF